MNLIKDLNEEQRNVVVNTSGPALVLAGPGSGKTRVLTYRVAYLIENMNIIPESILAVTFTNRAAREMKDRILSLLSRLKSAPWISTFHSFSLRMLRETAGKGLSTVKRNSVVYDDDDSLKLIKYIMEDTGIGDSLLTPSSVASKISKAKNFLESPDIFLEKASDFYEEKIAEVYRIYQDELHLKRALDFDDLLMKAVQTFETFPAILSRYQYRYRYILVDEFQDTNYAQYLMVKMLGDDHRNIFLVGDEDQSIYSWRGANLDNILEFEKDFPGYKLYKLGNNYRSTKIIVRVSSAVIKGNLNRKGKNHYTDNPEGSSVIYYRADTDRDEGYFVVQTIMKLKEQYNISKIAILYRTNAQSRLFEEQLVKENIPYTIVGGLRFYQRKEIKDIISYYRLILNIHDEAALLRIINTPRRGIGGRTVEKILKIARDNHMSIGELVFNNSNLIELNKSSLSRINSFKIFINKLREDSAKLSPSSLIKLIIKKTNYLAYLEDDKSIDASNKVENLDQLIYAAASFLEGNPEAGLEEYLDHISLLIDLDEYNPDEKVSLMTIHNAKGLEFDIVFLVGLEENLLPHSRSLHDENQIEEERRLCFVAMTRAAELLYLTNARRRISGEGYTENKPSRFIYTDDGERIISQHIESYNGDRKSPVKNTSPIDVGDNIENIQKFFKERNIEIDTSMVNPDINRGKDLIKKGSMVEHPKFGRGVVHSVEGKGKSRKAKIMFRDCGYKTLMLEYAELQTVTEE